ncbi:PilZ domain-containing protein [Desulfurobacterium sp.]
MDSFKQLVLQWLKEKTEKEEPLEVISFYNEVPVRVKIKPLSIENFKVVGWKGNSKILPAIDQTQKFFISFFHPEYRENRILSAGVLYYNNDYIETTFPSLTVEPKFNRAAVRITVSEFKPVYADIKAEGVTLSTKVADISEGGIGVFLDKGVLKLGEDVILTLKFPDGAVISNVPAKVVHIELVPGKKKEEKAGLAFVSLKEKCRNVISKYIIQRQKEIIAEFKMLTDE